MVPSVEHNPMEKLMLRIVASVLALIVLVSPAGADDVERVLLQYFDAMEYEDYDAAARLFDANDIKEFRAQFAFMKDADVNARQQIYERMFGPWASQESVEKMSDTEFFASIFGFTMQQSLGRRGMRIAKAEYLGHVSEGDDTAHAVTRITIAVGDNEASSLDVTSLVRRNGAWRMQVSPDIEQVATGIRRAVGQ